MTEPSRPRPVPGPPRPGTAGAAVPGPPRPPVAPAEDARPDGPARYAGLDERPVAEHVAVFEAEHDRLQRELATIDQL